MNSEDKCSAIWAVAYVAMAAMFAAFCISIVWHVSANDHAKIEKDRAVKIACVQAGKSLVGGNCVPVTARK